MGDLEIKVRASFLLIKLYRTPCGSARVGMPSGGFIGFFCAMSSRCCGMSGAATLRERYEVWVRLSGCSGIKDVLWMLHRSNETVWMWRLQSRECGWVKCLLHVENVLHECRRSCHEQHEHEHLTSSLPRFRSTWSRALGPDSATCADLEHVCDYSYCRATEQMRQNTLCH